MKTIDLRDVVHKKARGAEKISWQWYETHVRNAAAGMSAQKFLGDNIAFQSKRPVPGDIVSFFYDPKTKDTLKYYDTFPMVLPFAASDTHFTGLNLHYLSPIMRAVLLEKLMSYVTDDDLSYGTKINVSWSLLKSASQMAEIQPCVKQYLFGQVKSNFITIPPNEWQYVVWLPIEKFKKASNEKVWSDSASHARRR